MIRALEFEGRIRTISHLLAAKYGTPHLGNLADPTDEFVYIVLSRKTIERAYQAAFDRLKAAGSWAEIAAMDEAALEALIYGSGLERKKVTAIKTGLAAVKERFGAPDLARAATLPDDELFSFIADLPEVGPKSARCVMLYSFKRPEFPVDAHVGRVLARLGIFELLRVDLSAMDHKRKQAILADLVPPDLRYGLHVNLIAHGRDICRAVRPDCEHCPIAHLCQTGRIRLGAN